MYSFEKDYPGSSGFQTFGDSIWWTAMLITTIGSQNWPVSPEGIVLCFFCPYMHFQSSATLLLRLHLFLFVNDSDYSSFCSQIYVVYRR